MEIAPLSFTVVGTPAPQGSKTRTRYGMRDDNADSLKPWRADVTAAALDAVNARGGGPLWPRGEPVIVTATFYLRPPLAAVRLLERGLPTAPVSAPDADKLARGVGDSITVAQIWADDGQADWGGIRREWAFGRPTGVDVAVRSRRPEGQRLLLTGSVPTGLCHLQSTPALEVNETASRGALTVCGAPSGDLRIPAAGDRPCRRCATVAERYGWPVVGMMARLFHAAPMLETLAG